VFTACGITHPRCCRPPAGNIVGVLYHKLLTQCNAPEDGRNHRPKHVEWIGIVNKLLLLHLVGCLYYFIRDARSIRHHFYRFSRGGSLYCDPRFTGTIPNLILHVNFPPFFPNLNKTRIVVNETSVMQFSRCFIAP
jgi:hypothetical protein